MSYFPQSGTAPFDFGCIFRCGKPSDDTSIQVEMNRDAKGGFHGYQDHVNQSQRVSGMAHLACYSEWYEKTYGVAFTIPAE